MFDETYNLKKRSRILVHKGMETIAIKLQDIAMFYTQNRIVYVIDKQDHKYLYDKNLAELEAELDPQEFFRINRQYIVNIDAIRSFKPYERVKLEVKLNTDNNTHTIIVSQQTAPLFKKWIYDA